MTGNIPAAFTAYIRELATRAAKKDAAVRASASKMLLKSAEKPCN